MTRNVLNTTLTPPPAHTLPYRKPWQHKQNGPLLHFVKDVHTLTQSTTYDIELWPIIMRLIFVCGDLYAFGYYSQSCRNILLKRYDRNVIDWI